MDDFISSKTLHPGNKWTNSEFQSCQWQLSDTKKMQLTFPFANRRQFCLKKSVVDLLWQPATATEY